VPAWSGKRVTPPLRLERLTAKHAVADCITGQVEIDTYLHRVALTEQTQGLAAVWVAVGSDDTVRGFFTLSPISLRLDKLLNALPELQGTPYPQVGGYLLGRMGVNSAQQRNRVGSALVARAVEMVQAQLPHVGGAFLAVDPKTESLCAFYARLGFRRLDPSGVTRRMILKLA
jgi:GNAT superfamily N-acetyltransferase